jgi:hypothetical protein
MAYAEFYQPIQSALNGLNQQLNINADRDAQRAASGMARLMQSEELRNSRFGRDMQEASNERAERQLESDLQSRSFNQQMQKDQQARADARWKLEKPVAQAAAAKAEYEMTPRLVSMYNYLPMTKSAKDLVYDNPEFQQGVEAMFGGKFNKADGTIQLPDGKNLTMTDLEEDGRMADIEGLYMATTDPLIVAQYANSKLHEQKKDLQTQLKQMPADNQRYISQRANLKVQIDNVENQLDQISDEVNTDSLLAAYSERVKILQAMAGRVDNPTLASIYQTKLNNATSTFNKLLDDKLKAQKGSGKPTLGQKDWSTIFTKIAHKFGKGDPNGQWAWTTREAQMRDHAHFIAERMIKEGADPATVVNEAVFTARALNSDMWKYLRDEAEQLGIGSLKKEKNWNMLITDPEVAKAMEQFKEMTGYVPDYTQLRDY